MGQMPAKEAITSDKKAFTVAVGSLDPPTYDPQFGFKNGRKERVMVATEAEMISAKIPLKSRDYCAHHLINLRKCRRDVWPWAYQCKHQLHDYETCQYEDQIIRMKEYEREKRLKAREERIKASKLGEALG